MKDYLFFSFLFLLSLTLTYVVRILAVRGKILDSPNERSSHTVPTPRGGGLAIALVWYSCLIYYYLNGYIVTDLFVALMSGLLISVISLIDDIYNIRPRVRLFAQVTSALIALIFLRGLHHIDFGVFVLQGNLLLNLVSLLFILWFINLFNFLDGIDGYLASEGVFIFLALYFLSDDSLSLILALAILGFLFWNWPKAKIFCGDVGSTLIGFNVAIFAIYYQNTNQVSFIIPVMLSGLFWFDASITLVRRVLRKERISEAHKKHAYQRLHQSGYTHRKVLLIGIALNIFLLLFSVLAFIYSKHLIFFFFFHIILMYLYIKFADKRKKML